MFTHYSEFEDKDLSGRDFRSRQAKRDKESVELSYLDLDPTPANVLSSQTIQAASICLRKGQKMLLGDQGIAPSYASKEQQKQGHIFEQAVIQRVTLWLPKVNQSFNLELPLELPVYNCEITRGRLEWDAYIQQAVCKTLAQLQAVIGRGEPAILFQATFGESDYCGRADIVLYTGERFIMGDIKRSEEAMTAFGYQLFFYRMLLQETLLKLLIPELDPKTKAAQHYRSEIMGQYLHPLGFLIHYAKGYPFSPHSQYERNECLRHLQVTTVELDHLANGFYELADVVLSYPQQLAPCELKTHCVECQYRAECYPELLNKKGLDLSLLPLDQSIKKTLHALDIRTLGALAQVAHSERLQELFEHPDILKVRQIQAKVALQLYGCINWNTNPEWDQTVWFFAQQGVETCWQDEQGRQFPQLPQIGELAGLVVYTPEERRSAAYQLSQLKLYPEIIVLRENLQQSVHLPLPSYTLKALGTFFDRIRCGQSIKEILGAWFQDNYESTEQACETVKDRLRYLDQIWRGLNFLRQKRDAHALESP